MNKNIKIFYLSILIVSTLFSCASNKKNNNKTEKVVEILTENTSETVVNTNEKPASKQTFGENTNAAASQEKSKISAVNDSIKKTATIEKSKTDTAVINMSQNKAKQGELRKIDGNTSKPDTDNKGFSPIVSPEVNPDNQPIVPKKPPVIIYKMKADYSNNIPVILSADKKSVVRYPAPSDLFFEGKISRPTALANGFYLDNRGVNENVAFVSFTYDDYLNFKKAPTAEELFNAVIDANPLLEIYQLKDIGRSTEELNKLIELGNFPENYAPLR